jgi:predicted ABC-type transport system involved in lysophospholipase L1 biosynthesis ATPase subunit
LKCKQLDKMSRQLYTGGVEGAAALCLQRQPLGWRWSMTPVLVADEPTGNLDSKTAFQVFDLLEELTRRDKTVIDVTHDRDLAARATHRIDLLDGRILSPSGVLRLAELEQQGEAH